MISVIAQLMDLLNGNAVAKFDPSREIWSEYPWPTRAIEMRHILAYENQNFRRRRGCWLTGDRSKSRELMPEGLLSGVGLDARLPGRRQLSKQMSGVGGGCVTGPLLPGVRLLANAQTHATDQADDLHLPIVQPPSGDEPIEAYLALPQGKAGPPPVVGIRDDDSLDEN
jgi:hypothetical protein